MNQEKKPEKPQSSLDIRKIVLTNDKVDAIWKNMMSGGTNLTDRVKLPFTPMTPKTPDKS